jgi:hypothetical protein
MVSRPGRRGARPFNHGAATIPLAAGGHQGREGGSVPYCTSKSLDPAAAPFS